MTFFVVFVADTEVESKPIPEQTPLVDKGQIKKKETPEKPKVVVQQVGRTGNMTDEDKLQLANGQQPKATQKDANQSANKFIITPDYIQQSKMLLLFFSRLI